MRLGFLLAATAMVTMVSAPALAAGRSPAAKLAVTGEQQGAAPAKGKHGTSTALLIGLGAVAVIGVAVAAGSSDSKRASS
jgi:hypothetical protein